MNYRDVFLEDELALDLDLHDMMWSSISPGRLPRPAG